MTRRKPQPGRLVALGSFPEVEMLASFPFVVAIAFDDPESVRALAERLGVKDGVVVSLAPAARRRRLPTPRHKRRSR